MHLSNRNVSKKHIFFPVSYEQAVEKSKMKRAAPAIYNPRRLLEQPIPVVPAMNQIEASAQNNPSRRHSVPPSSPATVPRFVRPSLPEITRQTEATDTSALNPPGCSHWSDSEAARQSRVNDIQFEQSDTESIDMEQEPYNLSVVDNVSVDTQADIEFKVEMVPLHVTSTENSNEIISLLEESDETVLFENTTNFPQPMAATENSIIKRENDIVSGNIGFNETVSIFRYTFN